MAENGSCEISKYHPTGTPEAVAALTSLREPLLGRYKYLQLLPGSRNKYNHYRETNDNDDALTLNLHSMHAHFSLPLLTQFYEELMIPTFPLESERDALEDWLECLSPRRIAAPDHDDHGPAMDVLILTIDHANNDHTTARAPNIVAGIAFEYYKKAQTGLLSYMVASDQFRQLGIVRQLHPVALQALEGLHQKYAPYTTCAPPMRAILAETNTPSAGDVSPEVMAERHHILFKLGYRHAKFPYVQPPLEADDVSFDDIMLLVYCGSLDNTSNQSTTIVTATTTNIDTTILWDYVVDFYQSVYGYLPHHQDDYKDHWYYRLALWFKKKYPVTEITQGLPWVDVTDDLQQEMLRETATTT